MKKILFTLVIILASCLAAAVIECKEVKSKYLNAAETVKAYDAQLDSTKASNRAFKLTIDQLEHSLDSSFREFQNIRKQLNIKKKNV